MAELTAKEWEEAWDKEFSELRKAYPTAALQIIQNIAVRRTEARLGPKPGGGPSLLSTISSGVTGVFMLSKFWNLISGWKTVIGVIITILAFLSDNAIEFTSAFGMDAVLAAKVAGILVTIVGVAHKLYKFLYKEEHP